MMEQEEVIPKLINPVPEREIITLTPTQTLSATRTPIKTPNRISSALENVSPVFIAPNVPVSFKSMQSKQGSSIGFDFNSGKKDKNESSFFSLDAFKSNVIFLNLTKN